MLEHRWRPVLYVSTFVVIRSGEKTVNYKSLQMTNKTLPISFRLDPAVKAALEAAAHQDSRSVSSLASKVLADWLRLNGFLKA